MIPTKPNNVTWTSEQWQAIYEDNKNIIVSAGAGSGKTAVLTERVIRKLKDGVKVNELLILTFTKAAAAEMADRIRKKIKKNTELKEQLTLLDSAYITTFDSFSLAVVKKYHYLLNISPNIKIIDASIIDLKKDEIMDELFLDYYRKKDSKFLEMISMFCTKDDGDIRNYLINISNKLDLLSNKKAYLINYLDTYFDDKKIANDINCYVSLIKEKIASINKKVKSISYLDGEFASKLSESVMLLNDFSNYDELVSHLNIKLPMAPRGSSEELKNIKSEISDEIKAIKAMCCYRNEEEIVNTIKSTYSTVSIIIDLILEFSERVMAYKKENNCYEFNDIAIMAINILKSHEEVKYELKNSFKEIMIDEYQDTNDLQEEFISMISNNNVYMVGDIKQSIYRFRNANPYIFKNKYDAYANNLGGVKIDLNKNFRSREEVIDNINTIFNLVMDDDIGGADYINSHQMMFGNNAYNINDVNHSNDMEVYEYVYDKSIGYTKDEIEAFKIAQDIREKYDNKYQVFDKDTNELRDIKYDDFAIIMDRATTFELYKKIFGYFQIPITLLKNEKMNEEDDIHVISNLIRLIVKTKKKIIDTEFKYLFTSIMRSFLFEESDEVIFDYFRNNNFKESELYKKVFEISKDIDYMTCHELLERISLDFNYYAAFIKQANVKEGVIKISKLNEMALNLEELGYGIEEFSEHLRKLLETGYSIEYKSSDTGVEAVKIMTIHKSKGLEYPICYFSGLYKEFNISDLKERFLVDKDYGIIVPFFNEGIGQTIYKDLLKAKFLKEEISEKIRLFYVALTRAREKIILIKPACNKEKVEYSETKIDKDTKNKYRSLGNIIESIEFKISSKYITLNIDTLNLTHDYNIMRELDYKKKLSHETDTFEVKEFNISNKKKINQTFSKKMNTLISLKKYEDVNLGLDIHEYLEFMNLKEPDFDSIDNSFYKEIINKFLKQDLLKNIKDANVYQEYEFIYVEDDIEYHGIIDLMLEYDDYIDIIDYKLKHIDDSEYHKQLLGYYNYISTKSNKKINLYLYSLLDGVFSKVK